MILVGFFQFLYRYKPFPKIFEECCLVESTWQNKNPIPFQLRRYDCHGNCCISDIRQCLPVYVMNILIYVSPPDFKIDTAGVTDFRLCSKPAVTPYSVFIY